MTRYSFFVSDHPDGARFREAGPYPDEVMKSFVLTRDDEIKTAQAARRLADQLATTHKHVAVFRGTRIGRFWYGVFRSPFFCT